MNGINQMIAQGVRMPQIESPVNQLAQFEQIRGVQQANMLRQQQMAETQRQREQMMALNELYRGAYDPTTGRIDESKLYGGLAERGFGSQIPALQEQSAKGRKAVSEAEKAGTESVLKRAELYRSRLEGIDNLQGYIDWSMSGFQDPVLGPELIRLGSTPDKVMQRIQQVASQPGGLQRLIEESKLGAAKFAEIEQQRAGQAITMRGQDIQATTTRRGQDITAATTRRGQDIADIRERDIQLAENQAAAKARGAELAKNKVAAQAALPNAIATAEQTLALIDDMIGDARIENGKIVIPKGGRRPAPGFEGYVGAGIPGMRFIEGSDEASYERRQLQIEGKTFLEAFESLRGGGAITEIEGAKGQQAISRMNKAQSEVEYIKAARELQEIVRKGIERARAKAQRGESMAPGAPAAGAGAMNPAAMSDEDILRQLGM